MHFKNLLLEQVLRFFFKFLYLTGLTLLIPAIFTSDIPQQFWFFQNLTQNLFFYIVIGLIIISLFGMFLTKGSMADALKSMGLMTLIPGFLALLTALFGEKIIIGPLQGLPLYSEMESLISHYLLISIPKMWILTVSYLIIGFVLYIIGTHYENKP